MSVNGVNGSNNTQQTQQTGQPTVKTSSGSPTVGTSTGAPEPTEEGAPPVDAASEEGSGEGSIPSPDSDPGAYADYLEGQIETQEDLEKLREQLEYLAEHGDVKAQELLGKLNAAMLDEDDLDDLLNEFDEYVDYTSGGDLDGDGVKNKDDADIDGDSVTNEAELANGTSAYSIDTDGDQITDYGELWLKQHNYDYTWMDPTNPDANSNGIIDGAEMPTSVTVDNNGNPIKVGATAPEGGTTGSGEAGTASNPLNWPPPSADAQTPTWGDTVDGSLGDVVINLSGEDVEFSEGTDGAMILTNKATGQTITITDPGRVYFEGTSGAFSTNNFNLSAPSDTNGDGIADSGVHFASGMDTSSVTSNYDPFGGNLAKNEAESTTDMEVYNGGAGEFVLPESMGGNVVDITFEGADMIITVRGEVGGDPIKKFKVIGGKALAESGQITFRGTDGNDMFTAESNVTIHAGKGNDMITAGAGSQIYGEDGNDIIELAGTANGGLLDGGAGDDLLSGSDGVDTLVGGAGNDAAYSGASDGGDSFDMGTGDDIAIVSNTDTTAVYNIQMGGGIDMSNSTNSSVVDGGSVDVRMDDLDGLRAFMEGKLDDATGAQLDALEDASALADEAAQMAAGTVKDSFLAYLMKRKGNAESAFGSDHSGGFGDDTDVPPPPEEEPEGP